MPKRTKYKGPTAPYADPKVKYDLTQCNPLTGHKPNKEKTQCECGEFKIGDLAKDLGQSTRDFSIVRNGPGQYGVGNADGNPFDGSPVCSVGMGKCGKERI